MVEKSKLSKSSIDIARGGMSAVNFRCLHVVVVVMMMVLVCCDELCEEREEQEAERRTKEETTNKLARPTAATNTRYHYTV